MPNRMPKKASASMPYCEDQGIKYLTGAGKPGVSTQYLSDWPMPAGGVLVFADESLQDMDVTSDNYAVVIQNHTDAADEATVTASTKLGTQFTIAGADTADVLDIIIVGTIKGQLK